MEKKSKQLNISKRIFELRQHLSLSKEALGEIAGVSGTSIGNIESGVTKNPGAELLSAISIKLGVNPSWLLNGEGLMLSSKSQVKNILPYEGTGGVFEQVAGEGTLEQVGSSHFITNADSQPTGPYIEIANPLYQGTSNARRIPISELNVRVLPFLPFGARANFAEHYTDDINKYAWEHSESLAVLGVPDTKEYAEAIIIDVEGDSMEPTIINGSKVVVTPVQQGNWQYMSSGIYCIIYNGNFVVKRVKDNTLMESGILRLHSDNPNGGSFPVRGEDIRAVWRVRWAAYVPLQ